MATLQDRPGGAPAPEPAGIAAEIERVLAAERDAEADVQRCRARCAARVDEARIETRQRVERAEAVAQAIHARTEHIAERRAAALLLAAAPRTPGAAELDAIVAHVAELLTDGGDD